MFVYAYSQHINSRGPLEFFTLFSKRVDTPLLLHLTIVDPNLMLSLSHSLHLEFKEHLPSLFWVRQQAHILSFRQYSLFLQTHPKLSFFLLLFKEILQRHMQHHTFSFSLQKIVGCFSFPK